MNKIQPFPLLVRNYRRSGHSSSFIFWSLLSFPDLIIESSSPPDCVPVELSMNLWEARLKWIQSFKLANASVSEIFRSTPIFRSGAFDPTSGSINSIQIFSYLSQAFKSWAYSDLNWRQLRTNLRSLFWDFD